jgi:S1-C subfamily serine protease
VYAKEDDLVVAAVEKNQPRVARVHAVDAATSSDPLAIGFVISRDGLIVSETKSLFDDEPAKESYHVIIGEKRYVATLIAHQNEAENPVSFLKISDLVQGESLDAVSFGRAGEQKLAQTVVVLGGISGDGVFKTTLSKLRYIKSDATGTPQVLSGIETLPRIPDENLGGLVVNLDGQAVGMVISGSESVKYVIYPVARLLEQVGASQTASSEKTHDQSAIVSESSVF